MKNLQTERIIRILPIKFFKSDDVNLALPLARREANTLRPLAVAILERKPCLFFLFRLEG